MIQKVFKKIVLSSEWLTRFFIFFRRIYLKKTVGIKYQKRAFIGFSTICEGGNSFGKNSAIVGSKIGYGSYIAEGTKITKTSIGKYCSVGPNVKCIFGKHPTTTFVSTHPVFFSLKPPVGFTYADKQYFEEFEKKHEGYAITIGNDVWIGANVSLMDGVRISDGAIIAANALVTKDVPPYTIVGGIPARPIKKRFDDATINFLLNFKWWDKSNDWIKNNADQFKNIKDFINHINSNQG